MATINQQQVIIQLSSAKKELVKVAEVVLRENVYKPAVEAMNDEFNSHPVTREIRGGVDAKNDSQTLVGGNSTEGKNLYSFIGFSDGEDPIKQIEPFLQDGTEGGPKLEYVRGSQQNNLSFEFKVTLPSKEVIFNATPMPWGSGLSWAQRIEVGLSGFGYFLNKLGKGRSSGGIQVPNKLRPGGFRNTSYISEILNNFKKRITKS